MNDFQVSAETWAKALAARYPSWSKVARDTTPFRDSRYRTVTVDGARRLYEEFQTYMAGILAPYGVYEWVRNKGDCDYWSRRFVCYVLDRNMIGKSEYKPALAEIHFLQRPAVPSSGHSICSLLAPDGWVYELDPQPGCGLIDLTYEQAATLRSFDA